MKLNKRFIQYITFIFIYWIFWKITNSFELTVIIALGQIQGELIYKENKK